jgi:hypothetical protein
MPSQNGTGPMGMGPLTGRRAGSCAGNAMPIRGRGQARGFGMGLGGGRRRGGGDGRPTDTSPAPEQEAGLLEAQAKQLSATLDTIKRRIEELKSANPTSSSV